MTGLSALLAKVISAIIVLLGAMWWASHRQELIDSAKLTQIELEHQQKVDQEAAKAHGKEITAQSELDHTRDAYEQQMHTQDLALADERDTHRKLLDSIALYASRPDLPKIAGVPVPSADLGCPLVVASAAELADAGSENSAQLGRCAAKLTACEGWAAAVIKEYQ